MLEVNARHEVLFARFRDRMMLWRACGGSHLPTVLDIVPREQQPVLPASGLGRKEGQQCFFSRENARQFTLLQSLGLAKAVPLYPEDAEIT